jgi:hypothetical protein
MFAAKATTTQTKTAGNNPARSRSTPGAERETPDQATLNLVSQLARKRALNELGGSAALARSAPRPMLQMKTRIGPIDDPLEHEADRIANAVVSGQPVGAIGVARADTAQRKCAACEAEEEPHIHRKAEGRAPSAPARAEAAARALDHGGSPLTASQRAYFEPRFGRDLSEVRLHTHGRAATAAAQIQARAYTWQNDIAFAAGEFSPETLEGRRLMAHELAHVVQQAPHIARQPAPFHTRTVRDDAGGDALDYTETVQVAPTQTSAGIEGTVDRRVTAPATDTLPQQLVDEGHVRRVRLTPDCKVVVPLRIQFQQLQASPNVGTCQSPPNATPVPLLPNAQFLNIQNQYITALNDGLNNRFTAQVSGCQQQQPCTDKPLPIIIAAEAVTATPDITIDVVNRGGRADAGTICAGSFEPTLAIHEGGHQALGAPDEYREHDPAVIAAANAAGQHWERRERERSDLSAMKSRRDYGRFTMFHERHFRFAQVFLEAVFRGQGCSVSLDRAASSPWEFRTDFGVGGTSAFGGVPYASLFLGAGIPLVPRRHLMFLFGAQGQAFSDLGVTDRNAFMGGLRLGLEARTSPANFGVTANVFASGGGLYQPASSPPSYTGLSPTPSRTSPYGEVGGGLGLQFGMANGGLLFRGGLEAAAGREFSNDPNALSWWRLGVTIGISR